MNSKDARKLRRICKRQPTAAKRRRCLTMLTRGTSKRTRFSTKVRSCTPSDKGVRAWRNKVTGLRNGIERTNDPGRAEWYSAMLEQAHRSMVQRCGRRFASSEYMK